MKVKKTLYKWSKGDDKDLNREHHDIVYMQPVLMVFVMVMFFTMFILMNSNILEKIGLLKNAQWGQHNPFQHTLTALLLVLMKIPGLEMFNIFITKLYTANILTEAYLPMYMNRVYVSVLLPIIPATLVALLQLKAKMKTEHLVSGFELKNQKESIEIMAQNTEFQKPDDKMNADISRVICGFAQSGNDYLLYNPLIPIENHPKGMQFAWMIPDKANTHTVIIGRTGSGKGVFEKQMVYQVYQQYLAGIPLTKIATVDTNKGEYTEIFPKHLSIRIAPHQKDSHIYAIEKDLGNMDDVKSMCANFIAPPKEGDNEFFYKTGAASLEGIFSLMMKNSNQDYNYSMIVSYLQIYLADLIMRLKDYNPDLQAAASMEADTIISVSATMSSELGFLTTLANHWEGYSTRREFLGLTANLFNTEFWFNEFCELRLPTKGKQYKLLNLAAGFLPAKHISEFTATEKLQKNYVEQCHIFLRALYFTAKEICNIKYAQSSGVSKNYITQKWTWAQFYSVVDHLLKPEKLKKNDSKYTADREAFLQLLNENDFLSNQYIVNFDSLLNDCNFADLLKLYDGEDQNGMPKSPSIFGDIYANLVAIGDGKINIQLELDTKERVDGKDGIAMVDIPKVSNPLYKSLGELKNYHALWDKKDNIERFGAKDWLYDPKPKRPFFCMVPSAKYSQMMPKLSKGILSYLEGIINDDGFNDCSNKRISEFKGKEWDKDFKDGKLPHQRNYHIILDEFNSAAKMDIFVKKGLALFRSKGVSITILVQDIAPLKEIYHETFTDFLTANVANTFIMGISPGVSQKGILDMLGNKKMDTLQRSSSPSEKGINISESYQVFEQPVITPEILNSLGAFKYSETQKKRVNEKWHNIKPMDKLFGKTYNKDFEILGESRTMYITAKSQNVFMFNYAIVKIPKLNPAVEKASDDLTKYCKFKADKIGAEMLSAGYKSEKILYDTKTFKLNLPSSKGWGKPASVNEDSENSETTKNKNKLETDINDMNKELFDFTSSTDVLKMDENDMPDIDGDDDGIFESTNEIEDDQSSRERIILTTSNANKLLTTATMNKIPALVEGIQRYLNIYYNTKDYERAKKQAVEVNKIINNKYYDLFRADLDVLNKM